VAIVDREVLYRWFVAESLNPFGFRVVQFGTAGDAARCLDAKQALALMLVDAQTLADEGPAGIARLHARFPLVPCVVLELAGPVAAAVAQGSATAPKPIDSNALVSLVDAHVHHA
jgi:DNA-binding NtrC family response regulator